MYKYNYFTLSIIMQPPHLPIVIRNCDFFNTSLVANADIVYEVIILIGDKEFSFLYVFSYECQTF